MPKHYIGDGVYVDFDGYALILTTENGDGFPINRIVMEPEVIQNLNEYALRLKASIIAKQEDKE